MGAVNESAVTLANASDSSVVYGGRFFCSTRENAIGVASVVIGALVRGQNRGAQQLVYGVLYMPLLGEPIPVCTGDVIYIPHSFANDLPQLFLGDIVDKKLDLIFILARENPALLVCLPAHLCVEAPNTRS